MGQPFELAGTILGSGGQFSTAQIAGKPTIVYYWASWGRDVSGELKQLAELAKAHEAKGLQIVTVNLDDEPGAAVAAINAAQVPGTHLYMAGGLDRSPLAVAYGIQMVPHVFLVNREGKVTNRNAQTGPVLRDEVEKLVK
jgi:thiol-disulfide isomerase/thioredoxin